MKFSVYTSCALNYLPKARALAESLKKHHPDAQLTLCLSDVVNDRQDLSGEPFDQIWLPGDLGYDRAWIFQHSIMELCTAVKGRALVRLLSEADAEFVIYLDPDVYLFHPLNPIERMMEGASIGLVPHILCPEQTETGVTMTELSVTAHGTYNLGHLIVRNDANAASFANWWAARLDKYCMDDRKRGLFTDQRWIDLVPALFDDVRILRSPSLDVASWNLSGRKIRQTQAGDPQAFTVNHEPLITYHFSGTGPNGTHRRVRTTIDPGNAAVAEIEQLYEEAIAGHGQARMENLTPGFDRFDDATPVTSAARRLYRAHGDLRRAFPDPYIQDTRNGGFLGWLREHRPGMVSGLRIGRSRMESAFHDLFDEAFYLDRHPDVSAAIQAGQFADALDHYCAIGSRMMLDPNEFFVSSYYFETIEDQGNVHKPGGAGMSNTLLWHYLTIGLADGHEPIEFFDSRWYLDQNADVARAMRIGKVSTPFAHFLCHGSAEGRDPGPGFSGRHYLDDTPVARRLLTEHEQTRGAFGALVHLGGVLGRTSVAE